MLLSHGAPLATRGVKTQSTKPACVATRIPRAALQRRVAVYAAPEDGPASATQTTTQPAETQDASANGNGAVASSTATTTTTAATSAPVSLELQYQAPSDSEAWWTKFKLAFALLWRRFPQSSVLTIKLDGELSDQAKSWLEPGNSLPQICSALQRAALDPRVSGLAIEVGPLSVGYAKLQELRRHLEFFRASGKFSIAYMKQGGEKEYYIASACQELYVPPSASISLRGFVVGGTFLRGVLDKLGVEPQVQRIGDFKSAGDQLLRRDMSDAQREQLQAILDDTFADWVSTVAKARGKTEDEVRKLLDEGLYDTNDLLSGGWVDGLKYEDEVIDDIKKRTGVPEDKLDKPLKKVGVRKLNSVGASAYGQSLPGVGGKKKIVVLRTAGAILGKSSGTGASITPEVLIPRLRALGQDKRVAGVVLRVDSPGGDALASDLMWREVKKLAEKKPVIASMADVAASGGYYISMAARKIVAEPLTVTGSIGVVTGKFNLAELYGKIGYAKELISKGRYAELLADQRPFNEDEKELFERSAQHAYESFRNKAAESRGMSVEDMQQVAQGRVWTGRQALQRGLVDALGGVYAAVQLVRQEAGIAADEKVSVVEVGTGRTSPLALLRGATVAALLPSLLGQTTTNSPLGSNAFASSLGLILAPLLASGSTLGASVPTVSAAGDMSAAAASTSATAAALAAGASVGVPASAATALIAAAGACGRVGGAYVIEPEALGVQAAGSMEAWAAAQASGSLSTGPTLGSPLSLWNDEAFLNEP